MKILSKDFFILSNDKNVTIEIIRKRLLSWILILLNICVFPIVVVGVIEAVELRLTYVAILYLSFFIPILFAFLFQKKISYNLAVFLFLFSGYVIGIVNVAIYGFSGAGLPVFYTIAVL